MGILLAVFSGFLLSLVAPWTSRPLGKAVGWVYSLIPIGIVAYLATYVGAVAGGETFTVAYEWVDVSAFTVSLSFYLDGLSLFFALIVAGIGALIFIYAGGYLEGHHHLGRFFCYLAMFMASMIGMVLADNLFTFYIFFEGTSFASFVLIGFNHDNKGSRQAAWQALLVTKAGGLALLIGFILMFQVTGTFQISEIIQQGAAIQGSDFYLAILILVMAGAFTKSAQFPFYFWLPNAMKAPTPVSAYLHSATMVKAGIYVLARFHPALSGTDAWVLLITGFGAVTMLISAWLALQYTDMKSILAYTTVMALGVLTMLLGVGSEIAIKACMLFVLVHAFYKATLFMVAGAVDHEIHERHVDNLRGLRAKMPITATAAGLGALSMAGIPPFIGFLGKEYIYEAALQGGVAELTLAVMSLLANIALVAAACILAIRPFFGELNETTEKAHEAGVSLWIGPALLAVGGLVIGIAPGLFDASFLSPAVGATMGEEVAITLSLWHGFTIELLMSAVTVAAGVGVYFAWNAMRTSSPGQFFERWLGTGLDNGYDRVIDGILALGRWQTVVLQNGILRYYFVTILSALALLVAATYVRGGLLGAELNLADVEFYEWALAIVILGSALGTALLRSRISAIVSLGVMGFGIALLYLTYGAPDLAKTQFLVETLTVILFVLVLIELPTIKKQVSRAGQVRDAIIALAVGGFITLLMLAALQVPFESPMMEYYAQNTYTLGEGRNIVNTILVDFRQIDTMGEIAVLLIAGFGIYSLLRLRPSGAEEEAPEPAEASVEEPS